MIDAPIIFGLLSFPQIWLAVPLCLAFAACYAATREEAPRDILKRALKIAVSLFVSLALVAVILYFAV